MNPIVHTEYNLGRLWRSARLLAGYTQMQLSRELDIPQSSVSKFENQSLEPSALDWYRFCELVGIDAHRSLSQGYIDGRQKFKERMHVNHLFKVPLRYRQDHSIKIRELLPLRAAAISTFGVDWWNDFLNTTDLDDDLFLILDFQVSLTLFFDIMAWTQGKDQQLLEAANQAARDMRNHGLIGPELERKYNARELVKHYVANQGHYQRAIEMSYKETAAGAKVEFTPSDWISDFFDPISLDQYRTYKAETLNALVFAQFRGMADPLLERSGDKLSLVLHTA